MHLNKIDPLPEENVLRVVVETPRGSRNKFKYEPGLNALSLEKTLPQGMVFPFDFGFIPQTLGEDGDPIDAFVLVDEPTCPGCVVDCRLIGVMVANQTESGSTDRNDRFITVAKGSVLFREAQKVNDLPPGLVEQIQQFFVNYNKLQGKDFSPMGFAGADEAMRLIESRRVKP